MCTQVTYSDSVGFEWGQDSTFLTGLQGMLLLLVHGYTLEVTRDYGNREAGCSREFILERVRN